MKPNNEGDACAKCSEMKGEVPISDDEGNCFWICEYCDSDMFDNSIESKGLEEISLEIHNLKGEEKCIVKDVKSF